MKNLGYLALLFLVGATSVWANAQLTTPTETIGSTNSVTQSIDQDIFNNAKKFEIDAGYGTTVIPVGGTKDINLVRLELDYFPMAFRYYNLALGFGGAYNFFDDSNTQNGEPSRLVIFSATPILRYYIAGTQEGTHAYTEVGIGPSYLTSTHLGNYNYGIQYAFQLMAGVGVRFNFPHYAIVTGLRYMHWSNAQFSSHDPGINIPLFFYLGVQI